MSTAWRKYENIEDRLEAVAKKKRLRELREERFSTLNTDDDDDYSDIHDIWEDDVQEE